MTVRLIIVEGPDGAGKTTLVTRLAEKLGARVVRHDAQPGVKNMFPYFLSSLKSVARSKVPVIFDRCWLSEPIYGQVLRNGVDRVGVHRRALDRVALGLNAVMVCCLPPKNVVLDNWFATRANQLPDDEVKMELIYDSYASAFDMGIEGTLPRLRYDYTVPQESFEHVVSMLETGAYTYATLNKGPGIGHYHDGCVLIIGETPGRRDTYNTRALNWPFVSDQGCSAWLNGELDRIGVRESELYWINAVRSNGRGESPEFIDDLRPKRVVAMGDVARRWCLGNGVIHYHISHPQWWKRFHSKRRWFELDALTHNVLEHRRSV